MTAYSFVKFITLILPATSVSMASSRFCTLYDLSHLPHLREFVGLGRIVSYVLQERLDNFSEYPIIYSVICLVLLYYIFVTYILEQRTLS